MSWTSIPVSNPIDVILIHNNLIYTGSYNPSHGDIQMLDQDLNILSTIPTTGTFDLKISSSSLYAATSTSLIKLDLNLNIINQYYTPYQNTFIYLYKSLLYTCTSQGSIDVYSLDLTLQYSVQVSSDILWVCLVQEDTILCGGEEPCLFYVSKIKNNKEITKKYFDMGITSIFSFEDVLLVGSYDEHIYIIRYNITKHYIGGGVWRIKEYEGRYYITCMYEGVKVVDKDFKKVYKQYRMENGEIVESTSKVKDEEVDSLIYAMDICKEYFIVSTFYGKRIYKLEN